MWKLNEAGTHAKNKRADCTAFVTAAVIVNDEYETRIESMHDTLDEAKAALAKFVADKNAQYAKKLWKLDDDGNAHCPTGKIFRTKINADNIPFAFAVIKHTDVIGIESMETLTFTKTDDEARDFIAETVAKFNDDLCDMKEVTYYICPTDYDAHPSIWIIPYVIVDKNFNASLRQGILYVGNEPLYFDTLYVKTSNGVETFQYLKVEKNSAGEKYEGLMSNELYQKLQAAISEGGAKFRLEGRSFAERELTPKEIANMDKVFKIYELLNSVDVEK